MSTPPIEPQELDAFTLNRHREMWSGTADDMEDLLKHIEYQSRQLIEAHAIATTLRGELADMTAQRDDATKNALFFDGLNAQLRAERDTLASRVAELEVLVKCPREEDHLRIDALTAENGRLREELQYDKWFAERHNQHLESLNKADARIDELTALLRDMPVIHTASDDDWLDRVDATLAGGGDSNE
jgi:hypothetical protein